MVATNTEELLPLPEAAERLGVSIYTVRRWIKDGKLRAFRPGKEYRIREADLEEFLAAREVRPKAVAPPSQRSRFNGLEDERRTRWDADVQEARQLRKAARTQMQHALKAWRESKDRGEPYAIRHKHLDAMGTLLKKAFDAQVAVGRAYMQAALKQSSDAPLPAHYREESGTATDFYIDLWHLVQDADGLGIRTTGKQAGEQAESDERPARVEEAA